jgi:hypothetical protein
MSEIASSIRIVPIPEVPADGGLIQFLEGGHAIAEFEALAAATPYYKSPRY